MTQGPPLLVLALDGLDAELVDELIDEGRLPALARLQQRSWRGRFTPALPAVSPTIWTTMLTGRVPANHGVIDLVTRPGGAYGLVPCGGANRLSPTILQHLSGHGRTVASIGVPGTYPPERLDGASLVVSGFDAPWSGAAADDAIAPPAARRLIHELGGWRYGAFNELLGPGNRPSGWTGVRDALHDDLAQKASLIRRLQGHGRWDLFFTHLQLADTAAHHLWHLDDLASPLHPPTSPPAQLLASLYDHLDAVVDQLLEAHQGPVMLLSDHGMGGASGVIVHLNRLLAQAGLLTFSKTAERAAPWLDVARAVGAAAPQPLRDVIGRLPLPTALTRLAGRAALTPPVEWSHTCAWAQEVDASPAIHLNLSGRDPEGVVEPEEVDNLIDEVRSLLLNLTDPRDGAPVFSAVHRRDDIHQGPGAWRAPDLILDYAWKQERYRASVTPAWGMGPAVELRLQPGGKGTGMPGVHRGGGMMWLSADSVTPGEATTALEYVDVAPSICTLLGVPPISHGEGRPLPPLGAGLPQPTATSTPSVPPPAAGYTTEEQALVEEQLRSMGYLE